jgi:hypothetical protein
MCDSQSAQIGLIYKILGSNHLRSHLSRGHFYDKNNHLFKQEPLIEGCFGQMNVCQSAKNHLILILLAIQILYPNLTWGIFINNVSTIIGFYSWCWPTVQTGTNFEVFLFIEKI